MESIIFFVLFLASFYFLGKSADLVIFYIREIGENLGIKVFFLGILLGFLTSLPELFLGINAIISGIPEISIGNLLGGIIVLFGLILGISLVLNRKIKTDGDITEYSVIFVYLLLPLFLGIDGNLGFIDGLVIIFSYLFLLYFLYSRRRNKNSAAIIICKKNQILKKCILVVLGLISIVVISNLIIKFSIILLDGFSVTLFLVGLIVFSLGTNLPEFIVTVRSFHRKVEELSVSNITGSAMANVLIIGIFSFTKPIDLEVNISYFILMLFTILLFVLFLIFYKTKKILSRKEGYVLIAVCLLFFIIEMGFLIS